MSSRIPRPTYRDRNTTRLESARPGRGNVRPTNRALNGSSGADASHCGSWPLSCSVRRDRKRVSATNSPWGAVGTMSPLDAEMQNDDPSTRVTVPPGPRRGGGSPAKVHGASGTRDELTGAAQEGGRPVTASEMARAATAIGTVASEPKKPLRPKAWP